MAIFSTSTPANNWTTAGYLTISAATAVCLLLYFVCKSCSGLGVVKISRVGKHPAWPYGTAKARTAFLFGSESLLRQGYQQFKNSVYAIQTGTTDCVVLSHRYLPELRRVPENQLSSKHAHFQRHMSHWTGMDTFMNSDLHRDVVQLHLNQRLGYIAPLIADELRAVWKQESVSIKRQGQDYAQLLLHDVCTRAAAKVINVAIIGEKAASDSRWRSSVLGYTADLLTIRSALQPLHPFLRPLRFLLLSARTSITSHVRMAQDVLFNTAELAGNAQDETLSMVNWMGRHARGKDRSKLELTHKALLLGFAGIGSSSNAITNILLDLCAHPQYIRILREDVDAALKAEGHWTLRATTRMKRVDSFVKESLRLNPATFITFHRQVMRELRLSDGLILPKGIFIAVDNYHVAHDPVFYANADDFHPMRFYEEPRQETVIHDNAKDSQEGSRKLTATSPIDLTFGYSTTACPGRYFAACVLKLAVATLVHEYDLRFPDGQIDRPLNDCFDEWNVPSRTQKVLIRTRDRRNQTAA